MEIAYLVFLYASNLGLVMDQGIDTELSAGSFMASFFILLQIILDLGLQCRVPGWELRDPGYKGAGYKG